MDEQQLQQQIVQLVQAAMSGDQQANQQIQQIMQAAQQGDQQAMQIAQMIQQVAQAMQQQQVQAAKFGAKLNYIRQLNGTCPEGYRVEYFKSGGALCKRCAKVHQEGGDMQPLTLTEQFRIESAKCGKKMKKKACGGSVKKEACGSKMDKAACGKKIESQACGGKSKKIKKAMDGSNLLNPYNIQNRPNSLREYAKMYDQGVRNFRPRNYLGPLDYLINHPGGVENPIQLNEVTVAPSIPSSTPPSYSPDIEGIPEEQRTKRPSRKEFGGSFAPFTNRR